MNHTHSDGMGKHILLMLVCCLVPLVLVAGVGIFGLSLGALQPLILIVAALMCPLMMIGMMWMMMRGNHSDQLPQHTHAPRTSDQAHGTAASVNAPIAEIESVPDKCH